jgi:hypothetical protein
MVKVLDHGYVELIEFGTKTGFKIRRRLVII